MPSDNTDAHLCRICGLFHEDAPWGEDCNSPTFDICDCCGVEFGYEDATIEAADRFREIWIKNGAHWFNEKGKPEDWNLLNQLAKIGIKIDQI
jgi:hypothetical protein